MLAIYNMFFYNSNTMKMSTPLIIIAIILGLIFFEPLVFFLLSGTIPALNLTIPATTMLAVIVASAILIFSLRFRHIVYKACLETYDHIVAEKTKSPSYTNKSSSLPHRRYQEL